jgi:ABC-2 type transport system permease protein
LVATDGAVRQLIVNNLIATAGVPFLAERLQTPAVMINEGPPLVEVSFVPADLDLSVLSAALLVSLLFTYIINGSGALLLRAFQREAEAGVLEVVITSVTPAQFIGGKLLGLSILVLIQAGLTLLSGLLVYGQNPDGSGPAGLPPEVIPVVVLYLLFGYLAYSGLMLAIASLWPLMAESTQLQFFFRFALLTPLIGAVFILPDADGPLAVVLTMVPIASPLLMPFRVLITAVPTWQIGLSLLLLLAWAWFLLWLSTRLFRAHGLLTGRTPMLRAVWLALAGR